VDPLSLEAVEAALSDLGRVGILDRDAAAELLGATGRLIVYGSLAPGRRHHAELAELPGTWRPGWVTGALVEAGWGSAIGYDALRWDPAGERVAAHLLESDALPASWERLDAFEGDAYRRTPIPFFLDDGGWTVGQVYVLASRHPRS
jgi:gamma-glutamylcyclotransferase (GGCT)/AIG2-like uncharacterized protein YtfP